LQDTMRIPLPQGDCLSRNVSPQHPPDRLWGGEEPCLDLGNS
jgi:hypothetical protein